MIFPGEQLDNELTSLRKLRLDLMNTNSNLEGTVDILHTQLKAANQRVLEVEKEIRKHREEMTCITNQSVAISTAHATEKDNLLHRIADIERDLSLEQSTMRMYQSQIEQISVISVSAKVSYEAQVVELQIALNQEKHSVQNLLTQLTVVKEKNLEANKRIADLEGQFVLLHEGSVKVSRILSDSQSAFTASKEAYDQQLEQLTIDLHRERDEIRTLQRTNEITLIAKQSAEQRISELEGQHGAEKDRLTREIFALQRQREELAIESSVLGEENVVLKNEITTIKSGDRAFEVYITGLENEIKEKQQLLQLQEIKLDELKKRLERMNTARSSTEKQITEYEARSRKDRALVEKLMQQRGDVKLADQFLTLSTDDNKLSHSVVELDFSQISVISGGGDGDAESTVAGSQNPTEDIAGLLPSLQSELENLTTAKAVLEANMTAYRGSMTLQLSSKVKELTTLSNENVTLVSRIAQCEQNLAAELSNTQSLEVLVHDLRTHIVTKDVEIANHEMKLHKEHEQVESYQRKMHQYSSNKASLEASVSAFRELAAAQVAAVSHESAVVQAERDSLQMRVTELEDQMKKERECAQFKLTAAQTATKNRSGSSNDISDSGTGSGSGITLTADGVNTETLSAELRHAKKQIMLLSSQNDALKKQMTYQGHHSGSAEGQIVFVPIPVTVSTDSPPSSALSDTVPREKGPATQFLFRKPSTSSPFVATTGCNESAETDTSHIS